MRSPESSESGMHRSGILREIFGDVPVPLGFDVYVQAVRPWLRRILLATGAAMIVAALLTVLRLRFNYTPVYEAELVIMPTGSLPLPSVSTETDGRGLFLLGLSRDPNNDKYNRYVRTLRTTILAERLMAVPGLPQRIFANQWDAATGTWHPPRGAVASLRRSLSGQPWAPPDAAALAAFI